MKIYRAMNSKPNASRLQAKVKALGFQRPHEAAAAATTWIAAGPEPQARPVPRASGCGSRCREGQPGQLRQERKPERSAWAGPPRRRGPARCISTPRLRLVTKKTAARAPVILVRRFAAARPDTSPPPPPPMPSAPPSERCRRMSTIIENAAMIWMTRRTVTIEACPDGISGKRRCRASRRLAQV